MTRGPGSTAAAADGPTDVEGPTDIERPAGVDVTDAAERPGERVRVRPSRPARAVRAVRRSSPDARARAALVVAVLVLAAAVPLAVRSSLDAARVDAAALRATAADATDLRELEAAAEERATEAAVEAAERAAVAREERNAQRRRLAALGLSEATIDAHLEAQLANTELVEFRRDRTTRDVDRQAREIPTMEQCLERAKQAINQAFNTQFGNPAPPGPDDACRALLG